MQRSAVAIAAWRYKDKAVAMLTALRIPSRLDSTCVPLHALFVQSACQSPSAALHGQ
jgi:hypothetical protein